MVVEIGQDALHKGIAQILQSSGVNVHLVEANNWVELIQTDDPCRARNQSRASNTSTR